MHCNCKNVNYIICKELSISLKILQSGDYWKRSKRGKNNARSTIIGANNNVNFLSA